MLMMLIMNLRISNTMKLNQLRQILEMLLILMKALLLERKLSNKLKHLFNKEELSRSKLSLQDDQPNKQLVLGWE